MIHQNSIKAQGEKAISLKVRKIDSKRIMIEGDTESLLYLSEYIKEHATQSQTCEGDVPLFVNLIKPELNENEFELFLHRLPCDELLSQKQ